MQDCSTEFIIAVVDDDRNTLESLENLLEAAGHAVRLFGHAAALLDSGSLQEIDCLISDVGMPGMDGLELMQLAHGARPELPDLESINQTARLEISRLTLQCS